jgi:uncharacterized membrane protein
MKRLGVVLILFLAFCGLADAAYINQHEISGTPLLCNIQNLSGCNIVASSDYSHLFGISLAMYGMIFYAILFALAALELVLFDQILRRVLQGLAVIGVLFSLYFTFVQLFLIGAICIYCSASAVITLLVLIIASFLEPIRKAKKESKPTPPTLSMPPRP